MKFRGVNRHENGVREIDNDEWTLPFLDYFPFIRDPETDMCCAKFRRLLGVLSGEEVANVATGSNSRYD